MLLLIHRYYIILFTSYKCFVIDTATKTITLTAKPLNCPDITSTYELWLSGAIAQCPAIYYLRFYNDCILTRQQGNHCQWNI